MRVLRRVASTGRVVVATVHQPSADVFFWFTRLLLLAPGGHQAYFGPLGHHAADFSAYLSSLPGVLPLPPGRNPATWMLDVLGAGGDDAGSGGGGGGGSERGVAGGGADVASLAGRGRGGGVAGTPDTAVDGGGRAPDGPSARGEHTPWVARLWRKRRAVSDGAPGGQDVALMRYPLPNPAAPVEGAAAFAGWYAASELAARNDGEVTRELAVPDAVPAGQQSAPHRLNARARSDTGASSGDAETAPPPPPRPAPVPAFARPTAAPLHVQLWLVLQRGLRGSWRRAEDQYVRLLVLVYLGVLLGLLYLNADYTVFAGVQSGLGYMLGAAQWASVLFFTTSLTTIFLARGVYYRERAAGFYVAEAYSISALLVELPMVAPLVLVKIACSYWLAGMLPGAAHFFFFWLAAFALALFWLATGLAYSAVLPDLATAQIVGGLTISVSFLFSGLFLPGPSVPPGWKGLYYAMPTSHTLRALAMDQFYCPPGTPCPVLQVATGSGTTAVGRYQYVSAFLGTTYAQRWGEVGWVALAAAVMAVVAVAALRVISHQKR